MPARGTGATAGPAWRADLDDGLVLIQGLPVNGADASGYRLTLTEIQLGLLVAVHPALLGVDQAEVRTSSSARELTFTSRRLMRSLCGERQLDRLDDRAGRR